MKCLLSMEPVPVWVPSYCLLVPSVTSVRLSASEKDENEVKSRALNRSSVINLTTEDNA